MSKSKVSRKRRQQVLTESPHLDDGQHVVRVIQAMGENIYQVQTADSKTSLYRLPKKLRHIAFIKLGTYLFVRDHPSTDQSGKLCGDIEVVVMDQFLNSLRKESFWPTAFTAASNTQRSSTLAKGRDRDASAAHDWDIDAGNPNHRHYSDSDSDSDTE